MSQFNVQTLIAEYDLRILSVYTASVAAKRILFMISHGKHGQTPFRAREYIPEIAEIQFLEILHARSDILRNNINQPYFPLVTSCLVFYDSRL